MRYPTQRYFYNGKELHEQLGLGWYDYGARWYDAAVARWGQVDPLGEKYYSWSGYNYVMDSPLLLVDPDGESPISVLAKMIAKQGVKAGIRSYAKKQIQGRLQKYMSKSMAKEFAKDLEDILTILDNTWWETAIELIPVAGDLYGATKFGKKVALAYDKLQDLENRYVKKILDSLPTRAEKDRFKRNMRAAGVRDARRDQAAGVAKIKGPKYERGKEIDGHHMIPVADDPSQMTDPRNIEFLPREEHIERHRNGG